MGYFARKLAYMYLQYIICIGGTDTRQCTGFKSLFPPHRKMADGGATSWINVEGIQSQVGLCIDAWVKHHSAYLLF